MSAYADFLGKGNVTTFPCGQKRNFLSNLFNRSGKGDESPERIERIKETLKKTAVGRDALDFLAERGTKIGFEKLSYYGYFSPEKNVIALSSDFSDKDLTMTLVHEARHAKQDSVIENLSSKLTPAALLKNGFMIEADACAAECVLAHELKEQGDKSFYKAHQKTEYAPMSKAFENEFAKSGDADKAREAAMLKWYDLSIKNSYADTYVRQIWSTAAQREDGSFKENLSGREMAEKLCLNGTGKCYLSDPAVLDSSDKVVLDDKQAKSLKQTMIVYCSDTGASYASLGLDGIYHKGSGGVRKITSEMPYEAREIKLMIGRAGR